MNQPRLDELLRAGVTLACLLVVELYFDILAFPVWSTVVYLEG